MPVGLSATAQAELKKYAPRIRMEAYIIKNFYATATEIDITERVYQYGKYKNQSTLMSVNWVLPHLTMIVKNDDNYFNKYYASSVWQSSPAKEPNECILRIRMYVVTEGGEELAIEYLGRIIKPVLHTGDDSYCELETVFGPAHFLQRECTRRDGSYNHYDWSANLNYQTHKGGNIIPAPWMTLPVITTAPPQYGSTYYASVYQVSNAMEFIFRIHTATGSVPVGYEEQPQTYLQFDEHAFIGSPGVYKTLRWPKTGVYMLRLPTNYGDYYMYNPIGFQDINPALCAYDFLVYGAGLGLGATSLIDASSFGNQYTYFTGQTPSYVLRLSVFDKTFAEGLLDIMSYMPEMYLYWSYDSKLTLAKHVASLTSPTFQFTDDLNNWTAIELDEYLERAGDRIEVDGYSVSIEAISIAAWNAGTEGWYATRDFQNNDEIKAAIPVKKRKATSDYSLPASPIDKTRMIERPWISRDTGAAPQDGDAILDNWVRNTLRVWASPIPVVRINTNHVALDVEIGDVVGATITSRGLDGENYIVAGKDFDFDTHEMLLTLYQMDFT
jgi:hypothetical protein